MSSQKLLRCRIRPKGTEGPGSERYIPLEIFGLWEYLMTHRHEFDVVGPSASLWLDMEDAPEAAYHDHPYERVTEVTAYVYSGRDDMFTRARRYFATDDCERLKSIFLAHYQDESARIQTQVRERPGIWLHRDSSA